MIKNNIKLLIIASLAIVSCNNDDTATPVELPVSAGTANFTKFVSLGNSLTAGFSDNALFKTGQEGSYTNIMAQQFKAVGSGDFKIPLMNDNVGGLLFGGMANPMFGKRLYFNGVGPAPVAGTSTTEVFAPNTGGPYNNMGVPGAKSFHLLSSGYGNPANLGIGAANPYYVRFAPTTSTSILAYAVSQTPTFFSLWIGNNDVLSYATSGGTGVNQLTNPNPATYGPNDLTNTAAFASVYGTLVDGLTAGGAKGVVANLPYVSSIPFFTTVGYNPIPSLSAAQVSALNSAYAGYNAGLVAAKNGGLITEEERVYRTITFTVGTKKPVVMLDEYLTTAGALPKLRLTTKEDFIVLSSMGVSAQAHLGAGNGTSAPLQDRWVLSKGEVTELKTATDAFNASIKSIADAKGLAFVDANGLLNQVANGGVRFGNYHLSSTFATGGAFSLDGVHPSPRGYAFIANKFLEAVNTKYGSTFKMVDLGNYQIQYPASL